ncbi:MAG: nickel/cobalt transporter [Rhodospirillales bacterium]
MRLIGLVLCVLVLLAGTASAQGVQTQQSQTIQYVAQSDGQGRADISLVDRFTVWVLTQQSKFHRKLTGYLRQLAQKDGDWRVFLSLVAASFIYGVFHAAGPGHGKAVVSGYLLSHHQTLRTGIALSVASAFCQGLVAICIVYGLVVLAGFLPRDTQTAVTFTERASFAMVAMLGGYLLARSLRKLHARIWGTSGHVHGHAHHHGDDTDGCGHTHVPTAAQAATVRDFRSAIAVVLSVGIRPCTGAVIVLVFANLASLHWAGIGAVAAMSLGTAITVASLAIFAVSIRKGITSMTWINAKYADYAIDVLALAGGAVILSIGIVLLVGSFALRHPLMGL